MQSERYFIIGNFLGWTDERGQPAENEVLALIDDLTAKEAELIAKAVEAICEETDVASVTSLSETKSREDMVQHLIRCTKAAEVRAELSKRSANDKAAFYRLARYAVRFSEEVRKLRETTGEEQAPQRFEVYDEDAAQSTVFDATDTQHWGPKEYGTDWNGEFFERRVEETLYRHASGHWTLISEATHYEAPCSSGKRAIRVEESKAIAWLVRYGFELPADVAPLAADALFVPGAPRMAEVSATPSSRPRHVWYLFYRDSASVRQGEEADSGCPASDVWHLFDCLEDLTPEEVPILVKSLEAEFDGDVVDDGTIKGQLYEFDARAESEMANDRVELVRCRRDREKLENEYGGDREWSTLANTHWALHTAAHELANSIRRVRGDTTDAEGDESVPARLASVEPGATPNRGLAVDLDPPQVTLEGKPYSVSPDAALMVKTLLDADGEWVAGDSLNMRPDRVKKSLPKALQALIESAPGKGNRIPRKMLAELRQDVEQQRQK